MTNSKGMLMKPPPATGQIPAPPLGAPPPAPAKAGLAVGTLEGPPPKAGDAAKAKAKASPSSVDVNQTASGVGNTTPPSTISAVAVDHHADGTEAPPISVEASAKAKVKAGYAVGQLSRLFKSPPQQTTEEANPKAQAGYAVGQPLQPAPAQQQQAAPPPPPERVPGQYGRRYYKEGDIFEGFEGERPSVRRGFRWA